MTAPMQRATGYRLALEEKQIQPDPDAYFLSRF